MVAKPDLQLAWQVTSSTRSLMHTMIARVGRAIGPRGRDETSPSTRDLASARLTADSLRDAVDRAFFHSPLQVAFYRLTRGLAVLAYHGIHDPRRFSDQLDVVRERYHPLAPSDLVDALRGRGELPPRAVLITFDDADPTHLEHALPLLRDRELSAVAFVVAGSLGTDQPFWWQEAEALHRSGGCARGFGDVPSAQVLVRRLKAVPNDAREEALRELRASARGPAPRAAQLREEDLRTLEAGGIEIGSHSLTHPILDRCAPQKVREEILGAHDRLTRALGHPPRFFAYPNGDRDAVAEETLRGLGYGAAFLFDHRRSEWPPRDPLRISRLRVGSQTSLERFQVILSGLHPALHRLLGRS